MVKGAISVNVKEGALGKPFRMEGKGKGEIKKQS